MMGGGEQRISLVTYATAAAAVAVAVLLVVRNMGDDATFCRRLLTRLAFGDTSVAGQIRWDRFQALDLDVGAMYRGLPNDQERRDYRRAFIQQFAQGFRAAGATPESFEGWRVEPEAGGLRWVAAKAAATGQTLRFGVSPGWRKRLQALQAQQGPGAAGIAAGSRAASEPG